MINTKSYKDHDSYINTLYNNQNIGADFSQKDLCPKSKYEELLKEVEEVLKKNKDASLSELREQLYIKSGIEDMLKEFILQRKIAPGAVITYGTPNFQETLVTGNKQEVIMKNGILVPSEKEMSESTIFDLASCTKLFTAIATLKLIEQNQLRLCDDITDLIPEFKELKGITIFDLLTFEPLETKRRIDCANSLEEAEEILYTATKKDVAPGKGIYNDIAPMVLKYAIEKASGMPFYDYLSKEIFQGLDMNNTFTQIPDNKLDLVANGNYDGRYYKDGSYVIRTDAAPGISTDDKARILGQPQGILSGHAGLFSTSEDMTKLAKALINNKIINLNTRNYMVKNKSGYRFIDDDGNNKYTQYLAMLCYSKCPNNNITEVYHPLSGRSFASAGWSGTQQTIDPLNGINISFLSNRSHNRMTLIDSSKREQIVTHQNEQRSIILPNGMEMIDATRYAYKKDDIIHRCLDLALKYKMLEDITGMEKEKEKITRKIK